MAKNRKPSKPLDVWPAPVYQQRLHNQLELQVPKVFSTIENPNETLDAMIQFRRAIANPTLRHMNLDYSECTKLDLCASVLTDVLALRAKKQHRFRNAKLGFSGKFSGIPEIDLMLASSGMLKHLGSDISRTIPTELLERLRFSELRMGSPSRPDMTSAIEIAASDLAEFFDQCLKAERHQLKPLWKANLIQLITEVLDNAEEHGSGDKIWYTIGYYNKHEDSEEGGECHIAIFNFGESIYESLNRADTSSDLKRQIRELAAEHNRKGYFAIINRSVGLWLPTWEEESLWTLYALQEGVSRFRNKPEGIDRGNGTVKMIEFFSELASGKPQMALLSGRTHILFDGRYKISPVTVDGENRKIIAFNNSNDLKEKPDDKYVRTLAHHFPGTLVSLRFQLRPADLANIKEKLDADR